MRKATKQDKHLVVDIISKSFSDSPGIDWIVKNGSANEKAIKRLATLAFIKGYRRKGVFISANEKGVAICYCPDNGKPSIFELLYEFYFGITSIKISHIPTVLKSEAYKKSKRPTSSTYLYFLFYAVVQDGENAARELRDAVFEEAQKLMLPIYLETAEERNKLVYERYGFVTYHYRKVPKENIAYWFLKWEPK